MANRRGSDLLYGKCVDLMRELFQHGLRARGVLTFGPDVLKVSLMCLMALMVVSPAAKPEVAPLMMSGQSSGVRLPLLPVGSVCTSDPSCLIVGRTHMLVWQSPKPGKTFVVCIHGLGLCARAYQGLARVLSEAGIDGFGVNVRGFGPDRNHGQRDSLSCVDTDRDVCKLLRVIRANHPGSAIVLLGESMGGAIAIRIAAEHPELVDKLVCSAPAWKLLELRQTVVTGMVEIVVHPKRQPGPAGRRVMHQATSDPGLTKHLLEDPAHKLSLSLGEAIAFLHFISRTDYYARHLTKPTLIIEGLNDHLVSAQGVAKLFRHIPCVAKTFLIDGKGEHLILEEGQFTPAMAGRLVSWINADFNTCLKHPVVDVIDGADLSEEQQCRLSRLERLSRSQPARGG